MSSYSGQSRVIERSHRRYGGVWDYVWMMDDLTVRDNLSLGPTFHFVRPALLR